MAATESKNCIVVIRIAAIALLIFTKSCFCQFEVPDALVEVFQPQGLRVSIPDQEGIKLFAFHGKINVEMNGREGGTFSRDITKAKNGRWTFYDPTAKLKKGDTLFYWTYVDYFDGKNKLGYTNDDQSFVVKELLDKNTITSSRPPVVDVPDVTLPSGCKASSTVSNGQQECAEKLIFEENFNNNNFHRDLWSPEIKFAGSPDHEFVVYTDKAANIKITANRLKIRPVWSEDVFGEGFVNRDLNLGAKCTGVHGTLDCVQKPDAFLILPPVASAQITTKNKFSFKFGKVEIRAKLPAGDWIYPQLYLNPLNEEYGPDYASGQIRIAFLPGNENLNKNLQGGCILGDSQAGRNYAMKAIKSSSGSWCDDFHKFTVLWKPDQITVSVDGKVYGNVFAPSGGFASESSNLNLLNTERWSSGTLFAPFDKEMYLTVGVGVGGHSFEDRSDGTKPWQNFDAKGQKKFYKASSQWLPTWKNASALIVDYIKVWSL